jgi:hypothetical protein
LNFNDSKIPEEFQWIPWDLRLSEESYVEIEVERQEVDFVVLWFHCLHFLLKYSSTVSQFKQHTNVRL